MTTSQNHAGMRGFTLFELMLAVALVAGIAMVAVPSFQSYVERSRVATAISDIKILEVRIERFRSNSGGSLPPTLAEVGGAPVDPWGHAYRYFNIEDGPPGVGNVRKDKNLIPLNSDYDLYSVGKDGQTQLPLPPPVSHDDIIRANNGAYVGYGKDY